MEVNKSMLIQPNSLSFKEAALSVLACSDSTVMQLTQALVALEKEKQSRRIKIGVSSSVTVELLNIYLRKYGLLNGTKIDIVTGNYDDPIGDVNLFLENGVEQIVLLPFFDNLLPSFEAQLESMNPSSIEAKEIEVRHRYRMALDKARSIKAIYLGTFHRMSSASGQNGQDTVSLVLNRFNKVLREEAAAFANVRVLDTDDIVRTVGLQAAIDSRFYFLSKAPYTGLFMDELARRISSCARGFGAYFYKVLALDCDNTLWGGVIGEDLLNGIKLGPHDYPGNIFWRIQKEFVALEQQGILLALVSKNNPRDVDEVLLQHPDMVLRDSQLVAKKVNWKDKTSNLRALANELNVGLDSIIFLDDSSFECEAVRQQLPMVKTLQVPKSLSDYPRVVDEIKSLFLAGGISVESKGKTAQYRQRTGAEELKAQFSSQEEYLASLELKVELTRNASVSVNRISELSQKSNQFNLTTRRYSVPEVEQFMQCMNHAVYSLVVSDKFGSAGLTGVAVIHYDKAIAKVKNFFMSCRVIGRGVETCIWERILADAVKRGCTELHAEFIPSAKNAQVHDFYERLGMPLIKSDIDGVKSYSSHITDFVPPSNQWIEMKYVE